MQCYIVPKSCNAVLDVSKHLKKMLVVYKNQFDAMLTISKHFDVMLTVVFEHLNALLTVSKHYKAFLYSSTVLQC
jgi:hypothetical protein